MKTTIKYSVLALAIAITLSAGSVYAEPSPASGGPAGDLRPVNSGTPSKADSPGDKPKVPDASASPTVRHTPNDSDNPIVAPNTPGSPAEKPSPEKPYFTKVTARGETKE